MQMVDTLAAVLAVVHDQSEAGLETLLLGALSGDNHQMTQQLFVGRRFSILALDSAKQGLLNSPVHLSPRRARAAEWASLE